MTCKFCKTFPSMAGNSDFLKGCKPVKKENLKIHSESQKHKVCRDAVIAEKREGYVKDKFAQILRKEHAKKTIDLRKKFTTAYRRGH